MRHIVLFNGKYLAFSGNRLELEYFITFSGWGILHCNMNIVSIGRFGNIQGSIKYNNFLINFIMKNNFWKTSSKKYLFIPHAAFCHY